MVAKKKPCARNKWEWCCNISSTSVIFHYWLQRVRYRRLHLRVRNACTFISIRTYFIHVLYVLRTVKYGHALSNVCEIRGVFINVGNGQDNRTQWPRYSVCKFMPQPLTSQASECYRNGRRQDWIPQRAFLLNDGTRVRRNPAPLCICLFAGIPIGTFLLSDTCIGPWPLCAVIHRLVSFSLFIRIARLRFLCLGRCSCLRAVPFVLIERNATHKWIDTSSHNWIIGASNQNTRTCVFF